MSGTGYEPDMEQEHEQETPGPGRPPTRRIIVWTLAAVVIIALTAAFRPLVHSGAGPMVIAALIVAAGSVVWLLFWLLERTG
ncbi:hypothetical protein WIS52_16275 [Pseudonocardia nematodicida]|uniref:Uncharacterized protein n=1 Tax=Pseudonocardia nematodicida TaxID=1206997 RepID=A0ABV1KC27_9PSEU